MTPSEAAIIEFLRANPDTSRAQIRAGVAPDSSESTMWRALKGLLDKGTLSEHDAVAKYVEGEVNGLHEGNAIRYSLPPESVSRLHRS